MTNEQITLLSKKVKLKKFDVEMLDSFVHKTLKKDFHIKDDFVISYICQIIGEAARKDIVPKPLNPLYLANSLAGFSSEDIGLRFILQFWRFLTGTPTATTSKFKGTESDGNKCLHQDDSISNYSGSLQSGKQPHKTNRKRSRWRSRSNSPELQHAKNSGEKNSQEALNGVKKRRSVSIVDKQNIRGSISGASSLQKAHDKRVETVMQSSSEDEPTPYMLGDQEMGSTTPEIHACEPDSDTLKDPLMDIKKMHSVSPMKDLSTIKVPKETKRHGKKVNKEKKKKKKKKKKKEKEEHL